MISFLSDSPVFFLTLTLGAYLLGTTLYRRSGQNPLVHPILAGMILIIAVLAIMDIPVTQYTHNVEILHTLLGTATVALAVPIHENFALIRGNIGPVLYALILSATLTTGFAVGIAWLLYGTPDVVLSVAPKSITTPFAIGVSEAIGGYPSLTAALVILTGIVVAVTAPALARRLGIDDPVILGMAMGINGHGIATARAFELNPRTGAFSALGMGLTGIYISVLLPYLV